MTSSADAHLNDERVTIRIGSRPSILARHQADLVRNRLATLFPSFNFELSSKLIYTAGDRDKINPLRSLNRDTNIGGVSLWTTELEVALLEGEYDILVHSLKDVPTRVMDGCEIAPVLERADPRDCLVMKRGIQYRTLEEMPPGAVIGTGSVRRVAQLKRRYPSLVFQDVRGNVDTRLARLDDPSSPYTALILAAAGLVRLSLSDRITAYLAPPTLYPAPGQGCLGAEYRGSDSRVGGMIASLEERESGWLMRAERALLGVLEGGCSTPLGVWSTVSNVTSPDPSSGSRSLKLTLSVVLTSPDGSREADVEVSEVVASANEAVQFGRRAAVSLLDGGGRQIMEELTAAATK